jgi:L-aspartate oxidase
MQVDFLIVGSGIAGLTAALTLSRLGRSVLVVTKGSVEESATQWAQGGIAAAMHDQDTPGFHYDDTIKAGSGLCSPESVRVLVEEGPECVAELIQLGAQFDQLHGQLHYTKEAAHGQRRILHAGDTTGKEIGRVLGQAISQCPLVSIKSHTMVSQLLCNQNGECVGALIIESGQKMIIQSNATLIASGGCGQVFSHTTTPVVATGDGIALAYQLGCDIQDMEFIQFHPTTLSTGDKQSISIFLISEAVRGEGAVLRNIYGDRFMCHYHEMAELAPRDIVARSIYSEMQKTKNHVFLDLSPIESDIMSRFPMIYKRCLDSGIDIKRDFIPVSPAAHYCMGGIATSLCGETQVPRLFAAGEAASLGVHGANRLASNSLLDGLVFGKRAALKMNKLGSLKDQVLYPTLAGNRLPEPTPSHIRTEMLSAKQKIRSTMWRYVSIVRSENALKNALNTLSGFKWILNCYPIEIELLEVQNLLINAWLVTQSAYTRQESRGAHFRVDYPYPNEQYLSHTKLNCRSKGAFVRTTH